MKEVKRQATYTVEVPIRFTYSADNDLDCEELHKSAIKELEQRLVNGYFDILLKRLDVVDKVTHYTREEKKKMDEDWERFFGKV